MSARHVLLYDADCGFCRWCAERVARLDREGRVELSTIQEREDDLLDGMPPERRYASWHLVSPDGAVRSAGAAAGPLARLLPAARPLAPLFERFPRATDRAYRFVADHRTPIGKTLRRLNLVN